MTALNDGESGNTSLDDRARETSDPDARRTDHAAPYEKVLPHWAAASPVRRRGYRDRRHAADGDDGRPRRGLRAS